MTKQIESETTTTNQASPAHPAITALNQHMPTETLEAVQLLGGIVGGLREALPESTQRALTDFLGSGDPVTHAGHEKALKALRAREDAASYQRRAAIAEREAETLDALEPAEYAVKLAEGVLAKAERDAAWEKRQGAGTVSVSVWVDTDVDVNKEDLANAGYHHKSECPAGDNPLEPNHQLIQSVWDQLRDFHDSHHGLTLWQNCPHNPCKGIPEAFQREPWMHQVPDTDY